MMVVLNSIVFMGKTRDYFRIKELEFQFHIILPFTNERNIPNLKIKIEEMYVETESIQNT